MTEAKMLHVRDFLEEFVPPYITRYGEADLRSVMGDVRQRMGSGGTTKEWLLMIARVVGERGDPVADQIVLDAVDAFIRRATGMVH